VSTEFTSTGGHALGLRFHADGPGREPFITLNGVYPFSEEKFGHAMVPVTDGGAEMLTSEKLITHELWVA
jgi:hypothetical protein